MSRTIRFIAILILAFATQPAWTADHPRAGGDRGGEQRHKGSRGGMTAAKAAAMAQRQTGGRVLAVEESRGDYRVKVLTPAGEVRSIDISGHR